jgi:hypothetical protein
MAEALQTLCDICDEKYTDERPSLELPCQHSFCKLCIAQLEVDDAKICPFCRKSWEENLIDDLTVTTLKMSKTKLESDELKKEKEIEETDHICELHLLKVLFYCVTCSESVCQKCVTTKHRNHEFVDFDECAPNIAKNLEISVELKLRKLDSAYTKATEDSLKIEKEISILVQLEKQISIQKKERAEEQEKIENMKIEILKQKDDIKKIHDVIGDILRKKQPFIINKGQEMLAAASSVVGEVTAFQSSLLEHIASSYMVSTRDNLAINRYLNYIQNMFSCVLFSLTFANNFKSVLKYLFI